MNNEELRARHPLVQTNFAREKGSRANLLSLLHLFLLPPKSLLCNTFRGPHFFRYALFVGTSIARPKRNSYQSRDSLQTAFAVTHFRSSLRFAQLRVSKLQALPATAEVSLQHQPSKAQPCERQGSGYQLQIFDLVSWSGSLAEQGIALRTPRFRVPTPNL